MFELLREIREEINKHSTEFWKAVRDVFLAIAGVIFAVVALVTLVKIFGFVSLFLVFVAIVVLSALAIAVLVRFAVLLDRQDK